MFAERVPIQLRSRVSALLGMCYPLGVALGSSLMALGPQDEPGRLVVLATQEKLGYGQTFTEAMNSLFGEAAVKAAPQQEPNQPTPEQPTPTADLQQLINRAIQEFEDYQRLTSQGKLGEAGQKLEQHKRTLEEIRQKSKP